ncbi:hypothetical protein [Priestia megaterium]|uniref:hypothetical protein n=1 Tax=Priestia megaterium TaxID=1404 RepID=UPI002877A496|nr:hypothetical protein [Priestia megaterium]
MSTLKFNVGDTVKVVKDVYGDDNTSYKGHVGVIKEKSGSGLHSLHILEGVNDVGFYVSELELSDSKKDFVSIANEIGEFTQMKNEAYGSSVDATQKIMEVLMERYLNSDTDKYEFPRSLLKHMLLQVRIMDKQNRLFSNPDGDKLGESAYRDLTGYGLIGIEMDERNS